MSAALKLNPETLATEKLSRKPPLGEKRPKLRLVWENPCLSAGTHKGKPKVKPDASYGRGLYNYHRYLDPKTGRYLTADPIGILFGGNTVPRDKQLNHLYTYVGNNPLRYSDPFGLEPWDWDGQGNTSICSYYDQQAKQNPNCGYYKEAADICRGKSSLVNFWTGQGLRSGWRNGLQDSQSTVLNNIRQTLIDEDIARRQEGSTNADGCVCGNDIDAYHDFAFEFSGLPWWSYGGNIWPQDVWPNPVPDDPR